MATLFDQIIDVLDIDERKELIRELFHNVDGVSDYFWYKFAPRKTPKIVEENNIRRDTPSEKYLYNFYEKIWKLREEYEKAKILEVMDNYEVYNNNIASFDILSLDGDGDTDCIKDFVKELQDLLQINNIEYVEDWDFDDESGCPSSSGEIIIRMRGN